ncbi:MAG: LysM peptidoglycan-binding domain-containing protein [Chloroflexota bacterium]|nr:MAG: LysM peptidoglycan-binding domain-containing protein [Chloroflexota bacterium]
MIDRRQRALVVGDELPSVWRLQSVLLRAGFFPRATRSEASIDFGDERFAAVVFDAGVSGADALRILGGLRPPTGADVVPALFLGADASSEPGDRLEARLARNADDETIRAVLTDLIGRVAPPSPIVIPAPTESTDDELETEAPIIMRWPRRRPSPWRGPLVAASIAIVTVGAYVAFAGIPGVESPASGAGSAPIESAAAPTAGDLAQRELAQVPVEAAQAPATATSSPTNVPAASSTPIATQRPATATAVPAVSPPTPAVPTPTAVIEPTRVVRADTGIEGRVSDLTTGAAIPGASIVLVGPIRAESTAGGDGRYRITGLASGAYEVSAAAPGYARAANRTGVVDGVISADNIALATSPIRAVGPSHSVVDARTGQPVAVYGYPVRPGDTLGGIAERSGVTVADILALNRIGDPDALQPGVVINLPASTFGEK